jgi:hypothetical protein
MKKILLAILTASTIGTICLPVHAGDDVNIQDSRQTNIQTGNDNLSNQQGIQRNRQYRENSSGNTGSVQTQDQYSDQLGDRNVSNQQQVQDNTNIRRDRRR